MKLYVPDESKSLVTICREFNRSLVLANSRINARKAQRELAKEGLKLVELGKRGRGTRVSHVGRVTVKDLSGARTVVLTHRVSSQKVFFNILALLSVAGVKVLVDCGGNLMEFGGHDA